MWMFLRIELNGRAGRVEVMSPRRTNILESIDHFGSLSAAAFAVNLTFSQMWRIVRVINSLCNEPLIEARRGGRHAGALLTPLGKDILARFREIERAINESAAPYIRKLEKVVGVDKTPPRLPRFAQIIDPSTLPALEKSQTLRRKTPPGAKKKSAKKNGSTKKRPLKSSRLTRRR